MVTDSTATLPPNQLELISLAVVLERVVAMRAASVALVVVKRTSSTTDPDDKVISMFCADGNCAVRALLKDVTSNEAASQATVNWMLTVGEVIAVVEVADGGGGNGGGGDLSRSKRVGRSLSRVDVALRTLSCRACHPCRQSRSKLG